MMPTTDTVQSTPPVQMRWTPLLLRRLFCRRWILHQLSPLLALGASLFLLFHVATVHQAAQYSNSPEETRVVIDGVTVRVPKRNAVEVRPDSAAIPGGGAGPGGVERPKGAAERSVRTQTPPPPPQPLPSSPRSPTPRKPSWTNKKQWLSWPSALVADDEKLLTASHLVTLATQASLDRLDKLADLAAAWDGPISVSVFVPDVEHPLAAAYVALLRRCSEDVRKRVTFSLLAPATRPPRPLAGAAQMSRLPCGEDHATFSSFLRRRPKSVTAWRERMPYPQNTLRNLARNASRTEFIWVVDVDVVPVSGAAEALDIFLRSRTATACKRCVFVVPTYEVDVKVKFPEHAEQLLRLVKGKKARPFHEKVLIHNQFATNHSRWERHALEFNKTHISHPVTNFEFFYEPFYISRNDVPDYDERFVGYGFTRNTQVYETFCAGYRFVVLAPLFAVHGGLQVRKTRPGWREQQNNNNRKLFNAFKKDVFERYGVDPLGMMKSRLSIQKTKKIVKGYRSIPARDRGDGEEGGVKFVPGTGEGDNRLGHSKPGTGT